MYLENRVFCHDGQSRIGGMTIANMDHDGIMIEGFRCLIVLWIMWWINRLVGIIEIDMCQPISIHFNF